MDGMSVLMTPSAGDMAKVQKLLDAGADPDLTFRDRMERPGGHLSSPAGQGSRPGGGYRGDGSPGHYRCRRREYGNPRCSPDGETPRSGHGSWNTRRWWRVYWPPVSKRGEVPEEPSGAEGPFLFRCLGGHPIQAGLHRRWCMAAAVGRSQLVDVGWSGCRIRLTRRRIQPQALSHSPGDSFVQGRTHAAAMALDLGDEGLDLLPAGLVLHGFRG